MPCVRVCLTCSWCACDVRVAQKMLVLVLVLELVPELLLPLPVVMRSTPRPSPCCRCQW